MGIHDQKTGNNGEGAADGGAFKASEITMMHVADIRPYFRNAKRHDDEQVAKLAKEILRRGFDKPITVDAGNVVICGHGRLMAVKVLGWETVPVIVRADLPDDEVRAMRIADNKLAESPWEWDALKGELQEIDLGPMELSDLTGFSKKEIEAMLAPYAGGGTAGREVEEQELGASSRKCPRCGFEFGDGADD